MKHRLTHELLHYLRTRGYTMLVGIEEEVMKEFVFTPVEWDVDEFKDNAHISDYSRHSIHLIEDLLGVELVHLFTHRVLILENGM